MGSLLTGYSASANPMPEKETPTDRESVGALWVGLRPDEKWPYPLNTLAQGR